jgi:hypothetical protein
MKRKQAWVCLGLWFSWYFLAAAIPPATEQAVIARIEGELKK